MANAAAPMTSAIVSKYLQDKLNDQRAVDLLEINNDQLQVVGHAQTEALKRNFGESLTQDSSKDPENVSKVRVAPENPPKAKRHCEAILEITERKELAPTTICGPVLSSAITVAMSSLSFTASNEGYHDTIEAWGSIRSSLRDKDVEGYEKQWDALQMLVNHMLITATLWSPLNYVNRRKGNENSFYNNVVHPFLTCAFGGFPNAKQRGSGDKFSCGGNIAKELKFPDFALTMDCYKRHLGEHFLVIAEVKPPTASHQELDDDFIKLPNLMKLALDHQITQGYGGGTVVGILVQGWKVLAFSMALEREAVYELRNIGQFHLVADHTQMGELLTMCPVLIEAKDMATKTIEVLRKRPEACQAINRGFCRPSYDITPILIPRPGNDSDSERANENEQSDDSSAN
ncbi:hypothetical protein BGZ65_001847 [Modicella reniformis]|uniref:Uncharacterized protein n=1 Tax=Modicella reniformis TaxID=1440133 RepID=A0A9P6LT30_9FUNG|nr:hypothetical protein BGZ65_001847 [Modicella reniformis]